MWFSLADQTVYFLWSLVFGAALAAVYDIVRASRMLLKASHIHIVISDVIFFAACGVLTSLFALPFNKGDVRAFTVFGEAVGFLAYRLTLGSIFGKIYALTAKLLRQFIRKICEKLKKFFDLLLKAAAVLLYNTIEIVEGLFRTALSGARMLTGDMLDARARRRGAARSRKKKKTANPDPRRAANSGAPDVNGRHIAGATGVSADDGAYNINKKEEYIYERKDKKERKGRRARRRARAVGR